MTDTITNRQMKINLHAYSGLDFPNGTNIDIDYVCGATIFTYEMDDPIVGTPPRGPTRDRNTGQLIPDPGMTKSKRSASPSNSTKRGTARPQSKKMAERLWVNSRPSQSAVELCNSPTSRGSDFVSVDEGLFCDMDTKTLHPLCTADKKMGCFDLDADSLQLRRRDSSKMRRSAPSVKKYKKISYAD